MMNILPYWVQDQITLRRDNSLWSFRIEQLIDVHYYDRVNDKPVKLTDDLRIEHRTSKKKRTCQMKKTTNSIQLLITNEMEVEEEVVEMDDDPLDLMKVMDVLCLTTFFDDKEEKQRHRSMQMTEQLLHYHDVVSMKMVQQISVYKLKKNIFAQSISF